MKFLSRFVLVVLFVAAFINNPDALMRAFLLVCGAVVVLGIIACILMLAFIMKLDALDRETP